MKFAMLLAVTLSLVCCVGLPIETEAPCPAPDSAVCVAPTFADESVDGKPCVSDSDCATTSPCLSAACVTDDSPRGPVDRCVTTWASNGTVCGVSPEDGAEWTCDNTRCCRD
jgi:hypothetical protein